jgi:hypothetical protein
VRASKTRIQGVLRPEKKGRREPGRRGSLVGGRPSLSRCRGSVGPFPAGGLRLPRKVRRRPPGVPRLPRKVRRRPPGVPRLPRKVRRRPPGVPRLPRELLPASTSPPATAAARRSATDGRALAGVASMRRFRRASRGSLAVACGSCRELPELESERAAALGALPQEEHGTLIRTGSSGVAARLHRSTVLCRDQPGTRTPCLRRSSRRWLRSVPTTRAACDRLPPACSMSFWR